MADTHTVDLSEDAFSALTEIAELSHCSVEEVLASQIAESLEHRRWQLEQIREAKHEADNGGLFVAHEDLKAWAMSLGTDNELPLPEATLKSGE